MMLDMYDDNRNMLGVINQNVVNGGKNYQQDKTGNVKRV